LSGVGRVLSEIDRFFEEMERGEGRAKRVPKRARKARPRRPAEQGVLEPEPPRESPAPHPGMGGAPPSTPAPLSAPQKPELARTGADGPRLRRPPPVLSAPGMGAPSIDGAAMARAILSQRPPSEEDEEVARDRIRMIIAWAMDGHEEIKPVRKGDRYSFPELSELLNVEDPEPLLEELASRGLFSKKVIDRAPSCPNCSSLKLSDKYICPYCHEGDLIKGVMIEHYPCGHIDFLEEFERGEDLICPKCNKKLKLIGTDYRRIEDQFICLNCNRKFSVPNIQHVCGDCNSAFGYEKAKLKPIYSYVLKREARERLLAEQDILPPIADFLKRRGYTVSAPGIMRGKSGVVHAFDMMASKGDETLVFQISHSGDHKVLPPLFAKSFDIGSKRAILISTASLSDDAKRLARLYNIEAFEGKNAEEVIGKLRLILDTAHRKDEKMPGGGTAEEAPENLGLPQPRAPFKIEPFTPVVQPATPGPRPEIGPVKMVDISDEIRKLRERIRSLLREGS